MSVELLERPEVTTNDAEEWFTHILLEGWKMPTEDGEEFIPEGNSAVDGMVFGTPVKALCGFIWVPTRDPSKYPICPACVEEATKRGWKVPS